MLVPPAAMNSLTAPSPFQPSGRQWKWLSWMGIPSNGPANEKGEAASLETPFSRTPVGASMRSFLVLALLAGLLLAGCSTPKGSGTVPDTDGEGRYVIRMTAANKFDPVVAKVPLNATVVWEHDGGAPHDVQGSGFSSGDTGGMTEGDEYDHQFTKAGRFEYTCRVHQGSGMKGTLIVEDEADPAVAA